MVGPAPRPPTRTPEPPAAAVAGPASTGPPAGYRTLTVPASEFNTTAGFTMAVPDGWGVSTQGTGVIVEAPGGTAFLQIDLTPHTFPNMIVEARYLAALTRRQAKFPGYADQMIRQINLRGGPARVVVHLAGPVPRPDPGAGPHVRRVHTERASVVRALPVVARYGLDQQPGRVRRSNAYVPAQSLSPRRRIPGGRIPGGRIPRRRIPSPRDVLRGPAALRYRAAG